MNEILSNVINTILFYKNKHKNNKKSKRINDIKSKSTSCYRKKYRKKYKYNLDDTKRHKDLTNDTLFTVKDDKFMNILEDLCGCITSAKCHHKDTQSESELETELETELDTDKIQQYLFPVLKNNNPTGETLDFSITSGDVILSVLITPSGEVITNVTNKIDN